MNNRLKTMQSAFLTGRKDAHFGKAPDITQYNARKGSAWASWYQWGFDGLPAPKELIEAGLVREDD